MSSLACEAGVLLAQQRLQISDQARLQLAVVELDINLKLQGSEWLSQPTEVAKSSIFGAIVVSRRSEYYCAMDCSIYIDKHARRGVYNVSEGGNIMAKAELHSQQHGRETGCGR